MVTKKFVVCLAAALVVWGWIPVSLAGSPPQDAATTDESAGTEPERFEGYLFRDIDGNPLPFQSDAEIEAFLADAEVVSVEKIPVGVTSPQKLVLARGDLRVNAAFKKVDRKEKNVTLKIGGNTHHYRDWRDWYGYEIAAYRLDRLLGLDRVPPVIERRIKKDKGSVSIWLEGTIPEKARIDQDHQAPDIARFNQQKQTLRVFDNLIANQDSNLGNALIDGNWRIWFIDFSRCFGTTKELVYPEAVTHCEREVFQALRDLDRDKASAALSGFLTRYEIKALFERRDRLVAHLEALIAEQGEEMVLFDSRGPSERAPWALN